MGTINPAIMDKSKWRNKTLICVGKDIDKKEGLIVGYAMAFFDPFASPEEQFSFIFRTAHSKEYMDEDQIHRLETSFKHIMMGVQKIFDVDKAELEKWTSGECEDDLSNYIKTARFNS